MSKPVRIRNDVVARVEAVAVVERRSFANMVEVLLLAALTERDQGREPESSERYLTTAALPATGRTVPRSASPAEGGRIVPEVMLENPPLEQVAKRMALRDGGCSADTPRGVKCKLCGKVH